MPFAFVLSQTPRAKITDEAARVLAKYGRVADVNLAIRVAYPESAAVGQAVTESGNAKAADEIDALWKYVQEIIK